MVLVSTLPISFSCVLYFATLRLSVSGRCAAAHVFFLVAFLSVTAVSVTNFHYFDCLEYDAPTKAGGPCKLC